ncbi:uncharacterized protein LOC131543506, partial [Onychostoma macrolepis]|uniref:uncharacterized protein LOC131543506 n=1 Tax=Onychostoma macrolepis TaxID=369639 RepID=UPI00272B7857
LSSSSGVNETHVFCSSGENVRLSCNNALSGCTSTTWIYSRHSETVELIAGGIKKKDTERHERLSLGSDCSLNIKKVTKEDCGLYSCQQYVKEVQQGPGSYVYLHVLHVSSSSSQSEIRSGRSVTLSCQLYYDIFTCDYLVRSEGIDLIWVNQAGVNLQTDSRFQIFSSEQCLSSLTTTLLNEDHNREWRCQVTQRNQLKTSATYTVKYSAIHRFTDSFSSLSLFCPAVIVIIVEIAVFAAPTVILLQIICVRRAGRKTSHHPTEIEMSTVLQ